MQVRSRGTITKIIAVEAKTTESIEDLKQKIQYKVGVPKGQQHLYFLKKALKDNFSLWSCDIKPYSVLGLVVDLNIHFYIWGIMPLATFRVPHTETIVGLKKKIEDKKGIPAEFMRLKYAEKQLEDSRTLADYFVLNESTIHLVLRLKGC